MQERCNSIAKAPYSCINPSICESFDDMSVHQLYWYNTSSRYSAFYEYIVTNFEKIENPEHLLIYTIFWEIPELRRHIAYIYLLIQFDKCFAIHLLVLLIILVACLTYWQR